MTGLSSVAAVTCAAAFVFGMVLALLGSLKLRLAERLQIGEARVGGLISALNLALIPMMLLSGILIDALTVRLVLIVGSLVTAAAVFSLTLRRSYPAALASVLLVGVGAACLSTASVVLMPGAFGFHQDELAASFNLGNVFFALGALITPTLADLLLRTLDFRKTVAALALLCLVPALVAAVSFTEPTRAFDASEQQAGLAVVLGDARIWWTGLVFLLYAPLEFAVSTWGTTYLTSDLAYGERRAAWAMSFFWLAFLASRVLMTVLMQESWLGEAWAKPLLFVLALAAAAAVGNLAGAAGRPHAAWGLVLLGLALGPIFPTLIAVAVAPFPGKRGTAYGAMFAVGSLGSLFLAPLIGAFARGKTVRRALHLLAILSLLLVVATLALCLLPSVF
jgi:fucose permease